MKMIKYLVGEGMYTGRVNQENMFPEQWKIEGLCNHVYKGQRIWWSVKQFKKILATDSCLSQVNLFSAPFENFNNKLKVVDFLIEM